MECFSYRQSSLPHVTCAVEQLPKNLGVKWVFELAKPVVKLEYKNRGR